MILFLQQQQQPARRTIGHLSMWQAFSVQVLEHLQPHQANVYALSLSNHYQRNNNNNNDPT
jgi:hypothetical protein